MQDPGSPKVLSEAGRSCLYCSSDNKDSESEHKKGCENNLAFKIFSVFTGHKLLKNTPVASSLRSYWLEVLCSQLQPTCPSTAEDFPKCPWVRREPKSFTECLSKSLEVNNGGFPRRAWSFCTNVQLFCFISSDLWVCVEVGQVHIRNKDEVNVSFLADSSSLENWWSNMMSKDFYYSHHIQPDNIWAVWAIEDVWGSNQTFDYCLFSTITLYNVPFSTQKLYDY